MSAREIRILYANTPMQLILGHSALKLCEFGELRRHVGL